MATSEAAAQISASRPLPATSLKHVAAVTAGNALEFYDFLTYAFFAAQIGRCFFPSTDASASLLASLATFGAGFLMRPVGALVIGRIGDRLGRKPAMLLSFTLMGGAMVGLALTPAYGVIGPAAPALAILFRLAQGFALGGEVGPSTAFLIEAAPSERRGVFVAMQYLSQHLAVLCSGLVGFVISSQVSAEALTSWGWRAAFLLGAAIIPFGLLLRAGLVETLHAPAPALHRPEPRGRALARLVVLGVLLLAGGTTVTYTLNYLTTYASVTLHMSNSAAFLAPIASGLSGLLFSVTGGWLSDRFGRKWVMIAPWIAILLLTAPCFQLLAATRSVAALVAVAGGLAAALGVANAAALTAITESLPQRIRCGSLGLMYACAISVFGGTTQFTVAYLTRITHSPLAPAWYMTGAVAISLVAMLFVPESAPRRLAQSAFRSSR
jgi:MFS family permease